jgi:hypothetical protein
VTVYKINGQEVSRTEFNKNQAKKLGVPMAANTYKGHDPLKSEALGCHKDLVPNMRRMIKSEGISGVTVKDSGQLEITSRRGRKKLMRALSEIRGYAHVDNDGGYSDG